MTEISLNILDIAQNSVKAGAELIELSVSIDTKADMMTVTIKDNGCGMSAEQLEKVTDPFFTTRTTRKVGLGVSFFKMAAEMTGGDFSIDSTENVGTTVIARFVVSSIDRMPLGDISSTVETLVVYNTAIDFLYTYTVDSESFSLDTREMKSILDGVPLDTPDVVAYIREYLSENTLTANQGQVF